MFNKKIVLLLPLVVLSILFIGCGQLLPDETVSISDRIDKFEDDLNDGNYNNLNDNFHPEMISYYNYLDSSVISSGPLQSDNAPFTFGSPTTRDTNTSGEKSATGLFTNGLGATGSYSAIMKEDGDDIWKILEITITIGTQTYPLRTISN